MPNEEPAPTTDNTITEQANNTIEPKAQEPIHEHVKKTVQDRTYALRFVLSLVFGNIFIGCLIYCICDGISYLFGEKSSSYYSVSSISALVTALVVFGGLHLLLTKSVKKPFEEHYAKWQNVLSIIYCSAWALVGLVGIWVALTSTMNAIIDAGVTDSGTLPMIISGLSVAIVVALVIIEQMRLIAKLPKLFYTICMSVLLLISAAFMLVFPAREARKVEYDNQVEDDLYTLENAIEDYTDDHNTLPNTLSDVKSLMRKELNFDLSTYTYNETSYNKYKLCADFKTDTISKSSYYSSSSYISYSQHDKGHVCFDRDVYISSSHRLPILYDDADDADLN